MAHITKVMFDDQERLHRMFGSLKKSGTLDLDMARVIADEIEIYRAISEELVYPAVSEFDPDLAEEFLAELEEAMELVGEIEEMEEGDEGLPQLLETLQTVLLPRIDRERYYVMPLLDDRLDPGDGFELGRQAFARRQELLGDMTEREMSPSDRVANAGW